ncbi:hypothetical protein BH18THE1_BH18THE1_13370 [soil metagenome]
MDVRKPLKIMVVKDEEDILILYNDFLSQRGNQVISEYPNIESIMSDVHKEAPDIYLIDYKLNGNNDGIQVATEIIKQIPSAPILFITGYEPLYEIISKVPVLRNRNVRVLLKPVKLDEIEDTVISMTRKG